MLRMYQFFLNLEIKIKIKIKYQPLNFQILNLTNKM